MDDFERDLSRLMRDTRQHTPYEPAHRQRQQPETSPPATTTGGITPSGTTSERADPTPTATAPESPAGSTPPAPPPSPTPTTAPPPTLDSEESQ
ncbi:hypothetical protein ACFU3E_04700 [Streptomyces sp. NPDC057424]|uniref:hypothetical protein n=1 Tax=Streptomyces sp. NPDC057424 TaxID=3346127 RepID=UPI0036C97AB4